METPLTSFWMVEEKERGDGEGLEGGRVVENRKRKRGEEE